MGKCEVVFLEFITSINGDLIPTTFSVITNLISFIVVITCQKLNEEMQKRPTANQRVHDQIRQRVSRGDTRVP